MINSFVPQNFTLQWHITERCNWKCKHCYQNENDISDDLPLDKLFYIFDQFLFLIKKWQLPADKVFLNITGGEPLIRKDFFYFLEERVAKYSYFYKWRMLSNGSLLTEENIEQLKGLNIDRVQLSLEGIKKTNDEIRGEGTFEKIINSIELLLKNNIPVVISFTLYKKNAKDISNMVKFLERMGVMRLGVRRIVPFSKGRELKEYMLQPKELKNCYLKIKKINKKLFKKKSTFLVNLGCESAIFNDEILTSDLENMKINFCAVTQGRILTIMANGDIVPCRRLPIVVGNAFRDDSIYDVYYSLKIQDFRNLDKLHPFCQKCSSFYNCCGGAKCVTYAYTGKWDIPDVQCWKAYKKLGEPKF